MSDPTREVRYCAVAPIELREDTDKPLAVTGYAAVFGERTAIGPLDKWGWEEVVEAAPPPAPTDDTTPADPDDNAEPNTN